MIMLTGIVCWNEREDLSAADVAKVDAAEQLLGALVTAGELSHVPDEDGDRSIDLCGPPEKPR